MPHFIYSGGGIPDDVPRNAIVSIHESITVITRRLFFQQPNIIELICHGGVRRIEEEAVRQCRSLQPLIIPGVRVVEDGAFNRCSSVEYVECDALERVGRDAFGYCTSLKCIDLTSARVVQRGAFSNCTALVDVKFGKTLEAIGSMTFGRCLSLKQITIPLKESLIIDEDAFTKCSRLMSVIPVEAEELRETIAKLQLAEWRNDMTEEIDSINQILTPNAGAGYYDGGVLMESVEKVGAIQDWISRVLHKIIYYKSKHCHFLNETVVTLQHLLPNDIMANSVCPFLALPPHMFDGEDDIRRRLHHEREGLFLCRGYR